MKIFFIALSLLVSTCFSEVITVDQSSLGFSISTTPTQTLYWRGINSQALILFIPGGNGNLDLKPGTTDRKYSFYQTLKSLTNPELTTGKFDVVLIDFPLPLQSLIDRGSNDHRVRIESIIQFYQHKTGLPIWLMGHSNGGISLTKFIFYLQKNNKTQEIAGVVASAVRNGTDFNKPIDFPILFLHHEQDGCINTSSTQSQRLFEKVKELSSSNIQFKWITGGDSESADPCCSGFHMYYNSGTEASKFIENFITSTSIKND